MGFLDSIEKTVNTVTRTTNVVDRGTAQAKKVKGMASSAAKALAKKCKICKAELKSDLEKQKGICSNCALKNMK
ncbi:MAG: hypothetical protein Q7S56_01920 [Nanoarchaeota archaeon]|nr:hypothetical protein [Nanoarchaeota archaeon]